MSNPAATLSSSKTATSQYNEAAQGLLQALDLPKTYRKSLAQVVAPKFASNDSINATATKLDEFLESLLKSRDKYKNDPSRLNKLKKTLQEWAKDWIPPLQALLSVGKQAISLVSSESLFDT